MEWNESIFFRFLELGYPRDRMFRWVGTSVVNTVYLRQYRRDFMSCALPGRCSLACLMLQFKVSHMKKRKECIMHLCIRRDHMFSGVYGRLTVGDASFITLYTKSQWDKRALNKSVIPKHFEGKGFTSLKITFFQKKAPILRSLRKLHYVPRCVLCANSSFFDFVHRRRHWSTGALSSNRWDAS